MIGRSACVLALLGGLANASEPPPPPQVTQPPAWMPYQVVPGPSPAEIQALDQSGRRKKTIGAILMGVGSGIALIGTSLAIAGLWDDGNDCFRYSYDYYWRRGCGDEALTFAGATTTMLGVGTIVPGIILHIRGGSEVDQARRLRQRFWMPR